MTKYSCRPPRRTQKAFCVMGHRTARVSPADHLAWPMSSPSQSRFLSSKRGLSNHRWLCHPQGDFVIPPQRPRLRTDSTRGISSQRRKGRNGCKKRMLVIARRARPLVLCCPQCRYSGSCIRRRGLMFPAVAAARWETKAMDTQIGACACPLLRAYQVASRPVELEWDAHGAGVIPPFRLANCRDVTTLLGMLLLHTPLHDHFEKTAPQDHVTGIKLHCVRGCRQAVLDADQLHGARLREVP
ncbi:hypothetical protein F5X68DRAFT_57847 [Plectosphaerella plurivora]|uniref:Uncharacterized protein n=1 Tax=Plectosphaerella plurivora TaxID=936078 RepID=A0A9P8VHU9_9PEZI|nr:hypothetical protein F5X68DRAFT_57847 [Plectosphaerella plurivora]